MKREDFTTDLQAITNSIRFPGGGGELGTGGEEGGDDGDD